MYSVTCEQNIAPECLARMHEATKELLVRLNPYRESVLIHASEDLFADSSHHGYVFYITEGSYSWFREDEICFVVEQGDIIGIEEVFGLQAGRYASEFAVKCDRYAFKDITAAINESAETRNLWSTFLGARCSFLSAHLLYALRGEKQFTPSILSFNAGETIIEQGSAGKEVYTLVNGHADVTVDGVKVGEVLCDEIFGALAALTDLPRTASVIASQDSMVLSIEREKFLELIESRPATVLKMVQDMARTIVDLNKRVVEKEKLFR